MRTLNFTLFPHNNLVIFWCTMLILDTFVACDPRITPIDLDSRGQRSRSDEVLDLCIILSLEILPFDLE